MTLDKVQNNNNIMSEAEFNKSSLKNVMSYNDYFMHALKTGSTFDFAKNNFNFDLKQAFIDMRIKKYDEHNKESARLIENYEELEAIYQAMLKEQNAINSTLYKKYSVNNNNDLLTAMGEKNSLFDQGLYNKSAKSVSEAYSNFIAALQTANYQTHRIV